MKDELPLYNITLNDLPKDRKHWMKYISIVKNPAIQVEGMRFNEESDEDKLYEFKFAESEQQVILAPVAIPDIRIFRKDKELGKFDVRFSAEVIYELQADFQRMVKDIKIDMDHQTPLTSAYVMETWIIEDEQFDKSRKFGFNLPVGTWMAKVKVEDAKEWEEVKKEDRKAFSLEAFLGLEMVENIKNQINKYNQMNTKLKFERAMLDDSTPIWISSLEKGGEVYVIDENMEKAPIFDGEHKLTDGKTVVTVDGKITEVKDAKEEMATEAKVECAADAPAESSTTPAADTTKEAPKAEEKPMMDEAAVMALVQPKLDEIYAMIAEVKTLIEKDTVEDIVEDSTEEMKSDKFSVLENSLNEFIQFNKKKK